MACTITPVSFWDKFKDVRVWLHGIAAAAIGGASSTIMAFCVDPDKLNFSPEGLHRLWKVALVGMIPTVCAYLKQSPLPQPCSQEVK